jgi:hypothetical protein
MIVRLSLATSNSSFIIKAKMSVFPVIIGVWKDFLSEKKKFEHSLGLTSHRQLPKFVKIRLYFPRDRKEAYF